MTETGVIVIVVAVATWLVVVAYLQHRENMRRMDNASSEVLATLDLLQLRTRERWRLRWGILVGALTFALGVALLSGSAIAYHAGPRVLDVDGWAGYSAASAFLMLAGATILVANVVWSRQRPTDEGLCLGSRAETPASEEDPT